MEAAVARVRAWVQLAMESCQTGEALGKPPATRGWTSTLLTVPLPTVLEANGVRRTRHNPPSDWRVDTCRHSFYGVL